MLTLIKILLGLYDCEGAVYEINNKRRDDIANLRDAAAFAPAERNLFNLTLYDNLTFGDSTITREQIMALAIELDVAEWIGSLPNGLDTMLSEAAGNVSGGQSQMLNNMRVLLSSKDVMILDEPFSALDTEHEGLLAAVLNKRKDEKIFVVTSHRDGGFLDSVREIHLG